MAAKRSIKAANCTRIYLDFTGHPTKTTKETVHRDLWEWEHFRGELQGDDEAKRGSKEPGANSERNLPTKGVLEGRFG